MKTFLSILLIIYFYSIFKERERERNRMLIFEVIMYSPFSATYSNYKLINSTIDGEKVCESRLHRKEREEEREEEKKYTACIYN